MSGKMMKFWNFSSTLGRPNAEEKERKRRIREAQLQQIQRELTLDRRLITKPHRAKTFRNSKIENGLKIDTKKLEMDSKLSRLFSIFLSISSLFSWWASGELGHV